MFEFRLYSNRAKSKAREGPFRDSVVEHPFKIDLKKYFSYIPIFFRNHRGVFSRADSYKFPLKHTLYVPFSRVLLL
jgi:hypothetical protein